MHLPKFRALRPLNQPSRQFTLGDSERPQSPNISKPRIIQKPIIDVQIEEHAYQDSNQLNYNHIFRTLQVPDGATPATHRTTTIDIPPLSTRQQILVRKKSNSVNRNRLNSVFTKRRVSESVLVDIEGQEVKVLNDVSCSICVKQYLRLQQLQASLKMSDLDEAISEYIEGVDHWHVQYFRFLGGVTRHYSMILNKALCLVKLAVLCLGFSYSLSNLSEHQKHLKNLINYATEIFQLYLAILHHCLCRSGYSGNQVRQIASLIADYSNVKDIKKLFDKILSNSALLTDISSKIFKSRVDFHESVRLHLKESGTTSVNIFYRNIRLLMAHFLHIESVTLKLPILAQAPYPYLLPITNITTKKHTLLILADDCIFFLRKNQNLSVRPLTREFLRQSTMVFETVIYSNNLPGVIDPVFDSLDKQQLMKHRLYRYHSDLTGSVVIEKLGRSKDKLIIVSGKEGDMDSKINYVRVKKWRGDPSDTELEDVLEYLFENYQ